MEEKLVDFVIITALQEELKALLDKFPSPQRLAPADEDVRIYYQVDLPVTLASRITGTYRVVFLSLLDMGRVQAANATNDAIRRWHPRYVLLVGIAGGIAEAGVQPGDVLIAEQVADYELQKLTEEGGHPRWQVHRADPRLLETARHLEEKYWHSLIKKRRPQRGRAHCFIGPIATGDKVIAVKNLLDQFRSDWPKLIGIEMEAGGVASAAFQTIQQPGFLMIRGVSDLADKHKDDTWRSYACHTAAAYSLALLQSGPIPFSKQDEGSDHHNNHQGHIAPPEVSHKYLHWLVQTTETFLVPGLGVRLPIEKAWIPLKALSDTLEIARPSTLEAKIASYHEWERLSYHDHVYLAQDVSEFGHRVVVIGGPGAGKSTLCQRTTHRLARLGKRVLRVRLALVAQRCFSDGKDIDEAIMSVATAGSGLRPQTLVDLIDKLDSLLADGLDECGGHYVEMAEQLRHWASSHSHTQVVVTTRPIGYDPAFFEGWQHVELLPLDPSHINDYAKSILQHIEADPSVRTHKIQQLQAQIKTNQVASMATRSPLLLGFLMQLVHHAIPFAHHRATLYEQVLTLWYKMPAKDRSIPTSEPGVSFAREVLNRLGWLLQQPSLQTAARSRQGVVDVLAPQLRERDQSLLAIKEKIEHCLTFWQERGVLELLQVGSEEAYTFAHATLGEFAAARYTAEWNDDEIRTFVERVRLDAHWREPLLLAAGAGKANTIAAHLLLLERENDPIATESLLAAATLAETPSPSSILAFNVAQRIANRLRSTVPAVAYESARNAIGLAAQLAEQMRSLLHPLYQHPQQWTRLAALRLALASGDTVIDFDALETFFDEWLALAPKDVREAGEFASPETTQALREQILSRSEPWITGNEVLALGSEVLVRLRSGEATTRRLEQLARMKNGVSGHTSQVLFQQLEQLGRGDIVAQITEEHNATFEIRWDSIRNEYRQADQALLEAILRVTGSTVSIEQMQRQPIALSKLIYALQLPQCSIEDWMVLSECEDLAALDTVLRGTIAALNLDQTEIATDASWILTQTTDTTQTAADTILLNMLPKLPAEPDWVHVKEKARLSTSDLVRALCYPSRAIAFSAAQLLAAGAGGRNAPKLLEDVLQQENDFALQMIALIAHSVWGKEALTKLLHRLRSPLSRGCRWLLRELPNLSDSHADRQIREVLLQNLTADDPQIAIAAAETLLLLPDSLLEPSLPRIRDAFTLWSNQGDYCEHHHHYIHDKCCDRVPLCPRAKILRLLTHFSTSTLHELLDMCHDPQSTIRTIATQEIVNILTSQIEYIPDVIINIDKEQLPSSLLEAILSLPTTALITVKENLIKLFSSESVILRRIMVRNAATSKWLTNEQVVNMAQIALKDSDLVVRNLAVATLRLRKSVS